MEKISKIYKAESSAGQELRKLMDVLIDDCEYLWVHRTAFHLKEKQCEGISQLYCVLEPFYQNSEDMQEPDKEEMWKKIQARAKIVLDAFKEEGMQ